MEDVKKIAIILPHVHQGGIFSYAKNIVIMLDTAAKITKKPIEIILYCLEDFYNIKKDFSDLLEIGIKIREFHFKICTHQDIALILRFLKIKKTLPDIPKFYVIEDNFQNALDCDFWFLVSDRCKYPIAPLRPYAVLLHDYIQRYLPDMFGEWYEASYLQTARNADFVMTTIPETNKDVQNYAGIPLEKIVCPGLQFDSANTEEKAPLQTSYHLIEKMTPYCIWPTNTSMHKNSLRTLEALAQYYSENGNIKVIVTGPYTERFNPSHDLNWKSQEWDPVRTLIKENPVLQQNIIFCGNLPREDYYLILKKSAFLLHAALFDNGNLAILEAAALGIPSMSSDYPQTRYYDKEFRLGLHFFNPYHQESITKALHEMSALHIEKRALLPSKDRLLKNSYDSLNHIMVLWKPIQKILWPNLSA